MINFDAVEFSKHRPEEMISFFWRSIYFIENNENCESKFNPLTSNYVLIW